MTANMFQGEGGYTAVVGEKAKAHLPKPVSSSRIEAMKQGSQGPVLSELQHAQQEEKRQHEQAYIYEHGMHANDNLPLGKPSF